ncbi:MAG: FG-GAP repeat protein [Methanoregula sp.]|nr:FG-GAP repeat protein [Methanoregula sp.]
MLVFGFVSVTGAAAREQKPLDEIRLTAENPVANAQFGRSVAMDGDLVSVGEGGDGVVGAVYLYKRQGMTYVPEATLAFPETYPDTCPEKDAGNCPEFGRTVAIQGNVVFVGARFAPVGNLKAGAVYVFRKHGDSWQLEDKIVSPAPEVGDNFGRALAIQGDLLVVTARKNAAEKGAAYVFEKKGGQYVLEANILASDSEDGDYFGQAVDLQGDVIAVTARNANPSSAGAFYLFRRSGNGWAEIAKVTPENGKKNDQYGFAIAMAGDTIAVGARRADSGVLTDTGAAYVYTLKGNSVNLVTKLTASDASAYDEFGQSVAFAGDMLAVGAWKDDGQQGSIYLFQRKGGRWIETGKVTASDRVAGDEFGYSLAAFGNRMVTGAHFADAKAGAAYVLPVRQFI